MEQRNTNVVHLLLVIASNNVLMGSSLIDMRTVRLQHQDSGSDAIRIHVLGELDGEGSGRRHNCGLTIKLIGARPQALERKEPRTRASG